MWRRVLDKLRRAPIVADDLTFGRIRFNGRVWTTHASLPNLDGPVAVDVFAGAKGPTERQRKIYAEMITQFPTLRDAMSGSLFDAYRSQSMKRTITTASEISTVASLVRIEVCDSPEIDFVFDHDIQWEDEHQLNVVVKSLAIVDVAYEG